MSTHPPVTSTNYVTDRNHVRYSTTCVTQYSATVIQLTPSLATNHRQQFFPSFFQYKIVQFQLNSITATNVRQQQLFEILLPATVDFVVLPMTQ
jgi:hypothetical protein